MSMVYFLLHRMMPLFMQHPYGRSDMMLPMMAVLECGLSESFLNSSKFGTAGWH